MNKAAKLRGQALDSLRRALVRAEHEAAKNPVALREVVATAAAILEKVGPTPPDEAFVLDEAAFWLSIQQTVEGAIVGEEHDDVLCAALLFVMNNPNDRLRTKFLTLLDQLVSKPEAKG